MKYEYTTVYKIKGIEHKKLVDMELLSDADGLIRAVLTKKPQELARRVNNIFTVYPALANLLEQQENKLYLQLSEQFRNAATTTRVTFEDEPYVVIQIEGECEEIVGEVILENEDYFVLNSNADDPYKSISYQNEDTLAAVLASLVLETRGSISLDKVCNSIAMFRADGKQIISINFSTIVEFTDIDPLTNDAPIRITDRYHKLSNGKERLGTSLKLLKMSLETEKDQLRSFLFGWSALEIFVNTVFKKYDNEIFAELSEGSQSELRVEYLKRIRDVMKDKNRLADKFSVVALQLCATDAYNDAKAFKKIKLARDNLFHGSKTDENELPVTDTLSLLVKYLQLHLGENLRPATVREKWFYKSHDSPFSKSAEHKGGRQNGNTNG